MKNSFLLFFLISIAFGAVHAMDPTSPTLLHQDSGGQGLRCDTHHAKALEERRWMDSVSDRLSQFFVFRFRIPLSCTNELYDAVCRGDVREVRRLSEHESVDPDGLFPLHKALELKQTAIAQRLVEQNAQLNRYNKAGETPLHVATSAGFDSGVTLLLNAGAQPNLPLTKHAEYAPWGSTPLHCLVRSKKYSVQTHEQLLRLFLARGADIAAKEKVWGQTPVHLMTGNEFLLRALICCPHGVIFNSKQSLRNLVEAHLQHICSAFKTSDMDGVSPLVYAMLYRRSMRVLRLLSLDVTEAERLFGHNIGQGYKKMLECTNK